MRLRLAYRPSQGDAAYGLSSGGLSNSSLGLRSAMKQAPSGLWMAEGLADGDGLSGPSLDVNLDPLQSGLLNVSVGGPYFAVGVPGELGPWVGESKEKFNVDSMNPLTSRLSRAMARTSGGAGGNGLGRPERADVLRVGDEVLAHAQARALGLRFNPTAWFRERGYSSLSLQGYLSLAHLARVRPEFEWGPFGWEIKGNEAARSDADDFARHAAGRGVDDTLRIEEWEAHRMAALAMRFFTVEQVSLMMPDRSLASVEESVRDWEMSRYVERFPRFVKQPTYLVSPKAVREAILDKTIEEWEENSRRSVRRGQELHDLAVNDAIMVMALEAQGNGESLSSLLTEAAFFAMGERAPYPDFRMVTSVDEEELSGRSVQVAVKHDVEVVGLGANYRKAAKLGKVQKAGFRLFVPGYDGLGVRFGK